MRNTVWLPALLVLGLWAQDAMAGRMIDERQARPIPVVDERTVQGVAADAPTKADDVEAKSELPEVLLSGQSLSSAIAQYLSQRKLPWDVKWMLGYDYFVEADIPLAGADLKQKIENLVRTYQAHGGLIGARVRFADANGVIVFEEVDYAR